MRLSGAVVSSNSVIPIGACAPFHAYAIVDGETTGAMCDQCSDMDKKILRYREIAGRLLDEHILDRIEAIVAELLAAKEPHATTQE